MPLMKSRSKKAFEHNVKAEMHAGKPQPQSLAIAYSVKRKAPKRKMAEGGDPTISAANERRPMPDNQYADSDQMRRNKGNKAPGQDSWTDNPTIKQAQKPSITALSQPRMVESGVIRTKMRSDEHDLMDRLPPSSPKDQPSTDYNEMDARKQGDDLSDKSKEHSTKKKPYNEDVENDDTKDQAEADMYAKGGEVEDSDYDHPMEEAVDFPDDLFHDEEHLEDSEDPSEDEGAAAAIMRNERGPNRQGPKVPDMAAQHNSGRKPYYMGGPAVKEDHPHLMFEDDQDNMDMDDELNPAHGGWSEDDSEETMPVDEYMAEGGRAGGEEDSWDDNGHDDSISAAIMARRNRLHAEVASGAHDLDSAARYADGGEVDLSINHDEEPNNEDQMSFEALKKENYNSSNLDVENPRDSAQMGDEEERDSEDRNDMVSKIHRKMMAKRQFNR